MNPGFGPLQGNQGALCVCFFFFFPPNSFPYSLPIAPASESRHQSVYFWCGVVASYWEWASGPNSGHPRDPLRSHGAEVPVFVIDLPLRGLQVLTARKSLSCRSWRFELSVGGFPCLPERLSYPLKLQALAKLIFYRHIAHVTQKVEKLSLYQKGLKSKSKPGSKSQHLKPCP